MDKVKPGPAGLAFGVLLLGAMVYFLDRPAAQAAFVPTAFSLFDAARPAAFGLVGQSLPSFAHVFAFSLLTIALIGSTKKAVITACLSWFLIDAAFEVGQHPLVAPRLSELVPTWFEHIPILDRTRSYFLHGTFDCFDVLAAALGALAACVVIRGAWRRRLTHE